MATAKVRTTKKATVVTTRRSTAVDPSGKPQLLAGGNPRIAKGYGNAPVQAFLAAVPGWKAKVCARLDSLIERAVPNVTKAVKWNSPFYGLDGRTWFMAYHCMTDHVKVSFMMGAHLDPMPPVASKMKDVRYYHVREGESIDAKQFTSWVRQAARSPGTKL